MSRVTHRGLLGVVALLALIAVGGMAFLWPRGEMPAAPEPLPEVQTTEMVDATLVEVVVLQDEDPIGLLPSAVMVEVSAQIEATGQVVAFEMADETGDTFREGQKVRLLRIEQPGQEDTYFVSDFRRDRPLLLLGLLFVGAVVAFGRFQGVRALIGLVLTFVIIIGFIIPAILDGRPPVWVALFGALAIMIVTLYLAHGWSEKTTAAVVGTAGALALTGLLAVLFVTAASLTGFTSEEARLANFEVGGLSLQGLLLAGIIIGGLGVLDDVTMSQSSTVFELRRANPKATAAELFTGALNVGRDHIAATVNTLFLAYAGAALPLLILFVTGTDGIGAILTAEIVAVEVVRTLVGSLGLIAAVPLTSALAAAVAVGTGAGPQAGPGAAPQAEPAADPLPASSTASTASSPSLPSPAPSPEGPPPGASADAASSGPPASDEPDEDLEWEQRLRAAYGLDRSPPRGGGED